MQNDEEFRTADTDRTHGPERDPVLTPEEKAKLEFALEKHKELLILLSH